MNKFIQLLAVLALAAGCAADNQPVSDASLPDAASSPAQGMKSASRLFGGGYPTGGANATSIQGVPVGPLGGTGSVLTVGAGPSLEWDVPAAGVMLSSTTPAGVGTAAGAVGVGTTAARADHVHLLPIVPLTLGGFGQSLAGLLTTPTELGYLHNVISPLQSQLDAITAALVSLSSTTPAAIGTAAVGVGTTAARSDHVHALPGGGSTLPRVNGGFGQDVSTGLTNGYYAKVVGGAITIAAILAGDLPSSIDAAKIGSGGVSNAVFAYLANVTSDIQAQLNLLLPASSTKLPPTPTGANKLLYDTGAAYEETAACSSASTVLVGGSPPACAAVPDAALSANIVTLTGSQTLTNKTLASPSISGPVLSGSATGTYTLAGTPTITAPAISSPVLSGSATGTYTLAGTPTITSPAISGPTFSGTEGGTRTIGGTPTMGVDLDFGGSFKGTGLAAGSAAGHTVRWEQAGVAGPTFYLNTGQSFAANGYVGIAGDGSSTLAVNVVPWVVPVPCTLRNIRVFGFANTSGSVVFTIYKATAALSPSYAATVVTCTLTNTFSCTDTTHSVSLSAGDLVVGFTGSSWAANGASITSQCIPN